MLKKKKKFKKMKILTFILYIFSMFLITFGFVLVVILSTSKNSSLIKKPNDMIIENNNVHYDENDNSNIEPVFYEDFNDAVENAKYFPTSFNGKLTHYGPDCALCGGHLGCNGQDVRNGNIYYDDKEYGVLRIVATTKSIPCGSILKLNIKEYENMYVIVLDRGVSGAHVDLLKTSEKAVSPVRTLNDVKFDIIRWGY